MDLNYNGTNSKLYKKYGEYIIDGYCKGIRPKDISKNLKQDFNVKLSPQAITVFYYNNKKTIDGIIKDKKNEKLAQFKVDLADEIVLERLGKYFFLITDDLSSIVDDMSSEEKRKSIPTVANAISKLLGKDQSKVNVNDHSIKEIDELFKDDLNWG